MRFHFKLSSELNCLPKAYLIVNIVTNALTNYSTPLQIALGVLMRNSKGLVGNMSEIEVSCSYNELLRLKSVQQWLKQHRLHYKGNIRQ